MSVAQFDAYVVEAHPRGDTRNVVIPVTGCRNGVTSAREGQRHIASSRQARSKVESR